MKAVGPGGRAQTVGDSVLRSAKVDANQGLLAWKPRWKADHLTAHDRCVR